MSGLFGDVTRGMRELVREELQVARSEVSDKALDVATDAGMVAAGGVVAYAGYLTILGGAVDGLRKLGLPRWLSGVIVGSMVMIGGIMLILRGLDNLQLKQPTVEVARTEFDEAVENVQKDVS